MLHRAAYREIGLDNWTYEVIECDEAALPDLLDSLNPSWIGLSLTMPLKRAVLPLLEHSDPVVIEVGGANTVVFDASGRSGYNTDVPGMVGALSEAGITAPPATALLLGAGATACSGVAALHAIGLSTVTVAIRDPVTARPLLAVAERLGMAVRLVPFGAEPGEREWPLLISTVPTGAANVYADWILARALAPAVVLDVVYHPWPTRLAHAAGQAGATVISGFELLLHQAARQVELMTGRDAPTAAMRTAGLAEIRRRVTASTADSSR